MNNVQRFAPVIAYARRTNKHWGEHGWSSWWYICSVKLAVNSWIKKSAGHTSSMKITETMMRKGLQDSMSWSDRKAYMTTGQQRRRPNLQVK